jgi:hypothetical protein
MKKVLKDLSLFFVMFLGGLGLFSLGRNAPKESNCETFKDDSLQQELFVREVSHVLQIAYQAQKKGDDSLYIIAINRADQLKLMYNTLMNEDKN